MHGKSSLRAEFLAHLPYGIFGTVVGMLLAGIVTVAGRIANTGPESMEEVCHSIFHIFHPVHMLLSATATTAMFYRHESRRRFRANRSYHHEIRPCYRHCDCIARAGWQSARFFRFQYR